MKSALIIGAGGQDGTYLSEFLLALGYKVFGVRRRSTRAYLSIPAVVYLTGDVLDGSSILACLEASKPDEVYNLAADAFVGDSWKHPVEQGEVTGLGCVRILEAIRQYQKTVTWQIKFYQASTSELFGNQPGPQNEKTPFHPSSPYGVAKLFAHAITVNYRESYGMFACCGILFNHESPRRSPEFVTQKICIQAAEVKAGKREFVELGDLSPRRDWGYAPEYVKAMHLMLEQDTPDDYVVATGETHSIKDFLEEVLSLSGLGMDRVRVGTHRRPAEAYELRGDAAKISKIGWKPTISYGELARMMYNAAWEKVSHE